MFTVGRAGLLANNTTGSNNYTENLGDTLVFTDASTTVDNNKESLSDSLVLTDTQNTVGTFGNTAIDVLVLTDASATVQASSESRSDGLVLSDASATRLGAVEARTEALVLPDGQSTVQAMGSTSADTLTFSDSQNSTGSFSNSLAETVLFTDAINHIAHLVQPSLLDTVIFSDSESDSLSGGSNNYSVTLVDSFVLTDASANAVFLYEGVNDVTVWADSSNSSLAAYTLVLWDALNLTDSAYLSLSAKDQGSDTLTLIDSYRDLTIQAIVRWITTTLLMQLHMSTLLTDKDTDALIKEIGGSALIVSDSHDEIKRGLSSKELIATGD